MVSRIELNDEMIQNSCRTAARRQSAALQPPHRLHTAHHPSRLTQFYYQIMPFFRNIAIFYGHSDRRAVSAVQFSATIYARQAGSSVLYFHVQLGSMLITALKKKLLSTTVNFMNTFIHFVLNGKLELHLNTRVFFFFLDKIPLFVVWHWN